LRVPDDLSVVGFDGIEAAAWTSPPLTTVEQPIDDIAETAVNALRTLIAEPEKPLPDYSFRPRLRCASRPRRWRRSQADSLPMGPPGQAKKKRRLRPPTPSPPRWRLPVHRRPFWAGIAVGLGVSAALLVLVFTSGPSSPSANAPWGANRTQLRDRLRGLGLPALPVEGRELHTHEHLDLYLNGTHVAVPAAIGIDPQRRFFSPLHTHDRTGILHVESPTRTAYTLGQFFGVWGVRLSAGCIGGYCAGDGRALQAFVDGQRVHGEPAEILLRSHAEIVLAFGTRAELPKRIPSSYSFPAGY
jgi:hypothetical protein